MDWVELKHNGGSKTYVLKSNIVSVHEWRNNHKVKCVEAGELREYVDVTNIGEVIQAIMRNENKS